MPAKKTEPSVLDFVKAALMPWRGPIPEIPPLPGKGRTAKIAAPAKAAETKTTPKESAAKGKAAAEPVAVTGLPWRSLVAVGVFLFGQLVWGHAGSSLVLGLPIFLAGVGLFVLAARAGEWRLPQPAESEAEATPLIFRQVPAGIALALFIVTFFLSSNNRFTPLNVAIWMAAIAFTLYAFWQPGEGQGFSFKAWWAERFGEGGLNLSFSRWTLLLVGVMLVAAFFRFYQLSAVPPEMTSDHAEKLFDVHDVLTGQHSIFFPRNTGREPLQFYLTAFVANLFGTGVSFLSLKIGTALIGFLSLIYMYLLGKELGGRWVGLLAMLLTGIAYWPNVLSRAALRFALYPGLVAPVLFYLLRGFRRVRVNDFLLAGLFMGIGLHGYTPFRIVPLLALVALGVYLFHRPEAEERRRILISFALMALVALVVFTPLMRYAFDNPDMFGYRMFSRVGGEGVEYPGSPLVIFFQNLINALGMINVNGGNIWLVGVPYQPAVDLISAALFLIGAGLLLWRYLRSRRWVDLFLLLAIPILMLPSIMSLAFPQENPAMNRAGGALVVVFLLCALGLDALLHGVKDRLGKRSGLPAAVGLGAVLLLGAALINYTLVFRSYTDQYEGSAWNTSEMGAAIASFAEGVGSLDRAWVVSNAHWVDTRLVAINAGYPGHDYGIWPDQLATTMDAPGPKLFLLRPGDELGLSTLRTLYPAGTATTYESEQANKSFLMYFVAPTAGN